MLKKKKLTQAKYIVSSGLKMDFREVQIPFSVWIISAVKRLRPIFITELHQLLHTAKMMSVLGVVFL